MPPPGPALLGPEDPAAVEICNEGAAPVLLTCDHASNVVPRSLAGLGLAPEALEQHIGWDIGAASVTRRLARALGAPAIFSGYSRLVIDCNRSPDDPSSIPEASDGIPVPGNRNLAPEARAVRRRTCFEPYHQAIAARLDALLATGNVPVLLSMHSFTPVMNGVVRPWQVGILWDKDPRLPVPLLAALRADPSLVVGDNEPYSARAPAGYTLRHHAVARGLPHLAIELRQDLIAAPEGAASWAARMAAALSPILARQELYRIDHP